MSGDPAAGVDRAAELRRGFDASFAIAPVLTTEPFEDLLAIRVGGDAFAVRREEAGALLAGRKLSRLPGPYPEFLGVVGFRGQIVPVYSLRALLGYPRGEELRWAILAAPPDTVALAFDRYEGYLRLPTSRLALPDRSETLPAHVRALVRHQDTSRAVLSLPSVLDAIKKRVRPSGDPSKER